MIKGSLKLIALSLAGLAVILACEKKSSSGIGPDYKQNSGTGGNPNQNNPTVTGSSTLTNPATQNSSMLVGGTGWSNPTCPSTNSLALKGDNGESQVTLTFSTAIITGTYNIGPVPGPSVCAMSVVNAPGQPAGIVWIAKTGMVSVNTSTSAINASFIGIQCTQPNFIYPVVSVSGTLSCSQ
ncbi:MAG TPA: hypothetical protein PLQ93_09630 [Bacteroidia bacterium]|nr:hypothetical protein [Bacteroidia bacterium]